MSHGASLNAIGLKHGTDKASSQHDYLEFYETFLAPLRNTPLTMLEIGVFRGASLKMWEEYFPRARIIGADILAETKRFERDRVAIEILDQSNIEDLAHLGVKHGPFDIIIEDGSHMWDHQITTLRTLFPFVKNHGFYVVEDLQTNYGTLQDKFRGVAGSTCVEFLKNWMDLCVADDQLPLDGVEDAFLRTYGRAVQVMAFHRRACLIRKRLPEVRRAAEPGGPIVTVPASGPLVAVQLLAHVGNRGDLVGSEGFVNVGSDRFTFQGLAIDGGEGVLEYRVRWPDRSWSAWTSGNAFVGTRGQAKELTGVTVRLRKGAEGSYLLRTFARFAGIERPIEAADGQDCASPSGEALCGLQIALAARPAIA